ncbi:MAG: M48 family metallopeptidase [Candidatus Binatia bacterium]
MTPARWKAVAAALAVAIGVACATVPYTNRSQFVVVSESDELQLGAQAFQEVLKQAKVTRDPRLTEPVNRVGRRIAAVAEKPEYQWEFAVIDDPKQVNAFALPGGKVGVFTGLFPVAKDEAGLATVMGHEVAHAIARHGAERMSQGLALQIVGLGVAVATSGASSATQQAILQAYGLGAMVGVALPYSRKQESEADHIGLILMAKAGYDPEAAIGLWQRMAQLEQRGRPPEFLSTHPSPESRIEDIREWLPQIKEQYYRPDPSVTNAPLPPISGAVAVPDEPR